MHDILATAMVLGARKDRGGQILPNLTFRIQKRHISGTIPGKIQEPKFHAFISRNKDFGIMVPAFYLK